MIDAVVAQTPLSAPAIEATVAARNGVVARCREASGRRYALKAIDTARITDDDLTVDRSATLRHETDVLQEIPAATGHRYVASGQRNSIGWLLTRWVDGQASAEVAATMRDRASADDWRVLVEAIVGRVAALHAVGYVHGDLQPAHFLVDRAGAVNLVDFELAHRPGDGTVAHRGGLVHYNAPEIAQAMLDRPAMVPYDARAEVYSLGAVLHYLATGRTAIDYGTDDYRSVPFTEKLRLIAGGRRDRRPRDRIPAALSDAIEACLAHDPERRPALGELLR